MEWKSIKTFREIRLEEADIDALYHQILPAQCEKENA